MKRAFTSIILSLTLLLSGCIGINSAGNYTNENGQVVTPEPYPIHIDNPPPTPVVNINNFVNSNVNVIGDNTSTNFTAGSGFITNNGTNAAIAPNSAVLEGTEESFTTALKAAYGNVVSLFTSAWKTSVDNFIASGNATWGHINGLLSNQSDLQNELSSMNATIAGKGTGNGTVQSVSGSGSIHIAGNATDPVVYQDAITGQNVTSALGYTPADNATIANLVPYTGANQNVNLGNNQLTVGGNFSVPSGSALGAGGTATVSDNTEKWAISAALSINASSANGIWSGIGTGVLGRVYLSPDNTANMSTGSESLIGVEASTWFLNGSHGNVHGIIPIWARHVSSSPTSSGTNLWNFYSSAPTYQNGAPLFSNVFGTYIEDMTGTFSNYGFGLYGAGGFHSLAGNSRLGIGLGQFVIPSARLELPAAGPSANSSSLKIDPSINAPATPESGSINNNGARLTFDDNTTTRQTLQFASDFKGAQVYNSTNIILQNGTFQYIGWDSENYNNYSIHTTIAPGSGNFTAYSSGIYLATAQIYFSTTAGNVGIRFMLNGNRVGYTYQTSTSKPINLTSIVSMNTGDKLALQVLGDTGTGNITVSHLDNYLSGVTFTRIGNQ